MPEFKRGCDVRLPSSTHDHHCYREKAHDGTHSCYCGINWDKGANLNPEGRTSQAALNIQQFWS
jgi:hypothetical protein